MVRFILKCKFMNCSGCEGEYMYTIDGDIVKLEKSLTSGGYGNGGYERHELVGVEVIVNDTRKEVNHERS